MGVHVYQWIEKPRSLRPSDHDRRIWRSRHPAITPRPNARHSGIAGLYIHINFTNGHSTGLRSLPLLSGTFLTVVSTVINHVSPSPSYTAEPHVHILQSILRGVFVPSYYIINLNSVHKLSFLDEIVTIKIWPNPKRRRLRCCSMHLSSRIRSMIATQYQIQMIRKSWSEQKS